MPFWGRNWRKGVREVSHAERAMDRLREEILVDITVGTVSRETRSTGGIYTNSKARRPSGNPAALVINSRYIRGVFMSESTGKTIDQLDPYSALDTAQKTQFKSTAVFPARGAKTQGGELETLKMTIDEVVPAVPVADGSTISNTANVLSVANPVPSTSGLNKRVLTLNNSGEIVWGNGDGNLGIDNDGDLSFTAPKAYKSLRYDSASGGYSVETDNETIENKNFGTDPNPNYKLVVKHPVPEPAANHGDVGKVLTVKTVNNADEIVWETPQGGGSNLPSYTQSDAGKVLSVNQAGNGLEWANAGGGSSNTDVVNFTVKLILPTEAPWEATYILHSVDKTPQQVLAILSSGKSVFASIITKSEDLSVIYDIKTLPMSFLLNDLELEQFRIYFSQYNQGSGEGGPIIIGWSGDNVWEDSGKDFWSSIES